MVRKKESGFDNVLSRFYPIVLGLWLSGCVSIGTHERAKLDSFQAGENNGLARALLVLEYNNADDARYLIKGMIDLEEFSR